MIDRRRVLVGAASAVLVALVWWLVLRDATTQPRDFPDTLEYFKTARQPFAIGHLFGAKPLLVPVVFRWCGVDPERIARAQIALALVAWTGFGVALVASVRQRRARVAAAIATALFLVAPLRIGFAGDILSESLADSTFALVVAGALAVAALAARAGRRWPRVLAGSALLLATTAWILTRDVNAVTAIAAVAVAAVLWRIDRHAWRAPWTLALAVAVVAAAGVALWSARVRPAIDTSMWIAPDWPDDLRTRGSVPANDVILDAIAARPDAYAFFVNRGMPPNDALPALQRDRQTRLTAAYDERWYGDPHFAPQRAWIERHGRGAFALWLARHPITNASTLLRKTYEMTASREVKAYMPKDWHGARGVLGAYRWITASATAILVLLLATPWTLRRPRAHVVAGIAFVLAASALVGLAAAYFGDTHEQARHIYGAVQQLVLGLVLALVARLDGAPAARLDGAPAANV